MSDLEALKSAGFDFAPEPTIILDARGAIAANNEAAEGLFGQSLGQMTRGSLAAALAPDCGLRALVERCAQSCEPVRERGVEVRLLGYGSFVADASATPMTLGMMLISLVPRPQTPTTDGALDAPGLLSVVGLGHMLAHEIKNPLAGIRGAAQLLKGAATPEDIPLAQLIMDETDRIRRLVDRMEAFAEDVPPTLAEVNIHQVLDRVMALIGNGVADGVVLQAHYDPSLPPAWGEEDPLIQVFLNLAKNAAEAAHARGDGRGVITFSTAYRHGVRLRAGQGKAAHGAPLEIKIADNGPGVPRRLRDHLFGPFVTTKTQGGGLGLPLVAKLVAAHGGLIDFESEPGRTVFRVLLPVAPPVHQRDPVHE